MDRTFFSKYFSLEIRLLLIALLALNQLQAQNGDIFLPAQEENIIEMEIDVATQLKWLENAPLENTAASKSKIILISLPHPDGTYRDYKVVKAPIVSKDYQKKLGPNFQTYTLHDYDNPTTFGKLTITPTGLNAVILTTEGNIYIEPLSIGNKTHKVYWEKDGKRFVHTYPDIENYVHQHSPEETPHEHEDPIAKSQGLSLGVTLRQFDMLVLARPDYSAQHIGSATVLADQIANVEAAIMTTINNMNAYFERDMALRLNMVTPIVFINDPEDNFGNSVALFNETLSPASQNLNAFEQLIVDDPNIDWDGIDINTFDFAHLFGGTGGNGSAFLGVVCKNTFINVTGVGTFSLRKAGGGSISSNATGSSWYQLVAHEVCHQFNGQHTFNGSASNCGNAGQYAATDAYEPGSGTSIMSYHDICGDDNILDLETGFSTTIFYFHINSILNVEDYITNDDGQNCRTDVANSNNPPVAEADPCNAGTVTIPVNTPFELTGSATDIDVGDGLTYSWEQFDLGIQGSFDVGVTDNLGDDGIGGAENGAPIFRSRDPEDSPTRQFPTTAVLQNFTLGCGDLFISEILQGPGNDQCVEIYNPTDQAIDFSVTPYELVFGIDGSSSLQILTLSSGTIAANDVLVFCNTSISLAVVADVFYPSSLIIDGNDFIGLRKNSELIDEFGILGFNPGASGWTTIDNNPIFASGISFVRKPFICDGDNENSNSFNAFTEYNVSVLSISDIGSHTNGPEVLGEGLPLVDRIMTFNMTARDNNGGVDYDTRTINVSANGPLIVSTPSSAQNTGTSVSISWNANGFSGCSNADIFLSTDGGETFSYEVANNIDFSLGTHTFTLPLGIPSTTNAVYKVKCVDYECVAFFNWSREFEISSACTFATHEFSSDNAISFPEGSANLNLNLTEAFNMVIPSFSFVASTNNTVNVRVDPNLDSTPECEDQNVFLFGETQNFRVSATGTYTFTRTALVGINIFEASSFNILSGCGGFVNTNLFDDGGLVAFTSFTADLTAGVEYVILVGFQGLDTDITYTGPGTLLTPGIDPGVDYAYTYGAFDNTTNQLIAVNNSADFTSLTEGNYTVYGISFFNDGGSNSVNFASLIGSTLDDIINSSGACLSLSTNSKAVTVESLLPVELVEFNAEAQNQVNLLSWESAYEANFSHYEIEKSENGVDWQLLGGLNAKGNNSFYTFEDNLPFATTYYRLNMVDLDGYSEYSDIRVVTRRSTTGIANFYPNPTTNEFTVDLNTFDRFTQANLIIYDQLGRQIHQQTLTQKIETIDSTQWPEGIYNVELVVDGNSLMSRIVKFN